MTAVTSARLQHWQHLYGEGRGYLCVFAGTRQGDRITDQIQEFFPYPASAEQAADWIDRQCQAGRETYMCAHLLTDKVRQKPYASQVLALWIDGDGATIPDHVPQPTAALRTSPGREHCAWRLRRPIDPQRAEALNRRLAAAIGADPSGYDLTQLLRPADTVNHKYPGLPVVTLAYLDDNAAYDPDELERQLPPLPDASLGRAPAAPVGERIPKGERNSTLASVAGTMRRRGLSPGAIEAALQVENEQRCDPPLDPDEVALIAQSVGRYAPAAAEPAIIFPSDNDAHEPAAPPAAPPAQPDWSVWPGPIDRAAYYGLAGEIVDAIAPETEADPVALLVTFLAGVGNIVGRNPGWVVSGSRHGLRINPVFVGETAKARKGTSLAAIRAVLSVAAPEWAASRISSGMSSGEGLVWAVRDPITKIEPIKDKGHITGYQDVVVDPGIEDKRLFVVEEEFASVIKRMDREGNTLSAIIRQSWDSGDLRVMTKNTPAQATGAHITILGHITRDELLRYLTSTEAGNGFGNRFLWLCVRRSKQLPRGGNLTPALVAELGKEVKTVISNSAETVGLVAPDAEAWAMWDSVYGALSDGSAGLLGAMTSRAEPHVMRLAAIYALLDETNTISVDHLQAALAVWDYAEASARYIFGDRLGDPVADAILNALRGRGEMSRTDIRDLLGRNYSAARIDAALALLASSGKARSETRKADTGRPTEVWVSC